MATVRVEGLNRLQRNLRRVDRELPKAQKKIHAEIAEPIARLGAAKVNSKSGRLAGSVRSSPTQKLARVTAGTRLKYGAVNHWGWPAHNIEGNQFLTEAIQDNQLRIARDYDKLIGDFLERVWESNFV